MSSFYHIEHSSFSIFFIISTSHHISMMRKSFDDTKWRRPLGGAVSRWRGMAPTPPDLGTNGIFVTQQDIRGDLREDIRLNHSPAPSDIRGDLREDIRLNHPPAPPDIREDMHMPVPVIRWDICLHQPEPPLYIR